MPEDQPKVIDAFKQENLVRGLFNVKYRVKRPNGSIRWIKAKGFPVKNKLGETYRIAGIATDITEEKILKLSFQKSQTLFQILAKVSPVGIFHTDEKGFCTFVNDRWCEISSLTLEEAQGSGWRGALHPEDRDQVFSKWNDFAREGKTFQMEYRFLNTSGKSSWVFGQAEAEKDLENNIIGYVGTITDITQLKLTEFALKNSQVELEQRVKDRTSDLVKINDALKRDVIHHKETEALLRKAQEEAEKANSAKSEFLSHMSHELRTPLNAILGFAQLLVLNKRNNLDLKEQESVGQIRIAGNHLLELINEVLELTQIEGGSLKVHNENTDISRLLKKLLPVVEPMANKRKIIINNHISETSDSYVFADPTRLKQSLINLIVNAIKYNYEGGEISIKSEITDENRIKIHIIDTGPGIDAEKQKLLFEPFERLGAEDSGIEGTGIGLTITKKLMNLMDGSISLKSEMGKGSKFTIELPAGNRSEQTTEKHPLGKIVQRKTREENRNSQTILYIEDNNSNLKLIQKYLEEFTSFKFLSSQSAIDGLALARQHQPSLILMDINLPEMDEITAFKELQNWDETKSIPVIAVSANASLDVEKDCLRNGAYFCLRKPVNLDTLINTIRQSIA